jgi:hypothetical protein
MARVRFDLEHLANMQRLHSERISVLAGDDQPSAEKSRVYGERAWPQQAESDHDKEGEYGLPLVGSVTTECVEGFDQCADGAGDWRQSANSDQEKDYADPERGPPGRKKLTVLEGAHQQRSARAKAQDQ